MCFNWILPTSPISSLRNYYVRKVLFFLQCLHSTYHEADNYCDVSARTKKGNHCSGLKSPVCLASRDSSNYSEIEAMESQQYNKAHFVRKSNKSIVTDTYSSLELPSGKVYSRDHNDSVKLETYSQLHRTGQQRGGVDCTKKKNTIANIHPAPSTHGRIVQVEAYDTTSHNRKNFH